MNAKKQNDAIFNSKRGSTAHVGEAGGFRFVVYNAVLGGDGFYISYNNADTHIYGCDTTALVQGQMHHFYILNGDHRDAYKALVPLGFEACMAYFRSRPEARSKMSENPDNPFDLWKPLSANK